MDRRDVLQRREAGRIRASRAAARVVANQLHRRRGAVRAGGQDRVGGLVAQMLSEGTTHRTGEQLSSDLQVFGTSIGSSIDRESGRMSFLSTAIGSACSSVRIAVEERHPARLAVDARADARSQQLQITR